MKNRIFLAFSLATFFSYGQKSVEFHSITEINADPSEYKVIMISAPWCGICKANQELIENSENILNDLPLSTSFFKLENDFTEFIELDDETFHFVQRGPSVGEHQFISHLLDGKEIIFPTFVFLGSANERIATYQGFVSESDWLKIFGTILNHLASPDSVTSN